MFVRHKSLVICAKYCSKRLDWFLKHLDQKQLVHFNPFLDCRQRTKQVSENLNFYQTIRKEFFFGSIASKKIIFVWINQLISSFVIYLKQFFPENILAISIQNWLPFVYVLWSVIVQFQVYTVDWQWNTSYLVWQSYYLRWTITKTSRDCTFFSFNKQ